jgi:ribosomal protein S18 acetylase RimI-like enzyme
MNGSAATLGESLPPRCGAAGALDRQIWGMLTGRQAHLARGGARARRLDPRYGPFAAMGDDRVESQVALRDLMRGPGDEVWFVEPTPLTPPPGLRVTRSAALLQMVAGAQPGADERFDPEAVRLGAEHVEAMTDLALATEPGPWRELTHCYGPFYGIFCDGRLAAMAGERMLPAPGLAEVSGVCTWPEFRGQGLAGRLIGHVMAGFRARGDRPYLHTYADNAGAIGLYRRLGFEDRRIMSLTVMEPV